MMPAGQKEGGQTLLGGLDITVSRNFFGAQVCGVCAGVQRPRPNGGKQGALLASTATAAA